MTREELVADYKAKLTQDAETDDWTASDAAWEALSAHDQAAYSQTFAEAMLDAARAGELTAASAREWLERAEYNPRTMLCILRVEEESGQ